MIPHPEPAGFGDPERRTERTRWAMVGTGFMLRLIGHDLAKTENVLPSVIVSRSQERADEAAATYGFAEGSADLHQVLQRDDIDVVYVATPHSEHFRLAMAALEAGKHVLVEKAMTTDAASTRTLQEYANARGLFAMEAMWMAFNPAIVELRRRLTEGVIGEPRHLQTNFSISHPYDPNHRHWSSDLAGGSTLDQGVYGISLAHMLFGTPTAIHAHGTKMYGVDAEVVVVLEFGGGQRAVCTSGYRALAPHRATVAGSMGTMEIPEHFWHPPGLRQYRLTRAGAELVDDFSYEPEGAGYVPMLRGVSEAVLQGRTEHPARSHTETLAVAETMDEVLRQVHELRSR